MPLRVHARPCAVVANSIPKVRPTAEVTEARHRKRWLLSFWRLKALGECAEQKTARINTNPYCPCPPSTCNPTSHCPHSHHSRLNMNEIMHWRASLHMTSHLQCLGHSYPALFIDLSCMNAHLPATCRRVAKLVFHQAGTSTAVVWRRNKKQILTGSWLRALRATLFEAPLHAFGRTLGHDSSLHRQDRSG